MGKRTAQIERKLSKYAIQNLMMIIVGAMAIVFIADLLVYTGTGKSLISMLYFDRAAIAAGQWWRVITFIFCPPDTSLIFIIFALYFYWLIGSALERAWGTFRFNLYYLCGIVGAIISGLITGYATNNYLNMSLFLAFAFFYPEFEVLLFFILPVKIKWLAYIDAALIAYSFIMSRWSGRLAILFSLSNLVIFFYHDIKLSVLRMKRNISYRISEWRSRRR